MTSQVGDEPNKVKSSPSQLEALDSSPWYQGIDLRKHQVVRTLGFGGFGVVYLASVALGNGSSKEMAVKSVRIMRPTTASEEAQHKYVLYCARREEEGMKVMQGSLYALHLYGSSFNYLTEDELLVPRKSYDIYMELAEKGTLKDELNAAVLANPRDKHHIRSGMLLPEMRVAEVAHAVLSALVHMNRQGYAHCDIKPENILFMADSTFRLGDPGVACATDADGVLKHAAGTLGYLSPEMHKQLFDEACPYPVTLKTDMYSVARLLGMCAAWYDDTLSWGEYMRWEKGLPECVPKGLKELVASMVHLDPAKRPSPLEALDNKWLVGTLQGGSKEEGWRQRQQLRQQQLQRHGAPQAGAAAAPGAAGEAAAAGPSPADAWW